MQYFALLNDSNDLFQNKGDAYTVSISTDAIRQIDEKMRRLYQDTQARIDEFNEKYNFAAGKGNLAVVN